MEDVPAPAGSRRPEPGAATQPPWARDGRRLGRYRLGPALGRGGMGEVFEAWDTLLNRPVAVKTLNVRHPAAILRFMKEAQLQARVGHPGVCRIFDVEVWEGTPFIAMQLVRGPDLHEAAPRLSMAEAVAILERVAEAMHAAHGLQLIHRDLKPSNILLERSPSGGWLPYVADFGLAKDLAEDGLTQDASVLGTPSYMAPEQARGARVGPATDVYALGATLCAVLGLERRDRAGWDGLPSRLRAILERCLEERPEDRYRSADALAEDFRRFRAGEPLQAEGRGWTRPFLRMLRRHPAWAASLAITVLLGGGFAAGAARLHAAARRRTVLALRFATEARALENQIGLERLHPPHDLRPVRARMTQGLIRIEADIAGLGPEALGPGNLALGRGYLAMRDLEPALAALERAWAAGYRTPDVAYALCKTHCDFYIRALDQAQLGDRPPAAGRAEAELEAARTFYALSAGAAWEPPELCGARILNFQGRSAEALALARDLAARYPSFYEAVVEEAYALGTLGYQHQRRGDARAAQALYRQAEAAARRAQAIGRSDITGYLAAMDWRLHWLENPGLGPAEALPVWAQAEQLVDVVLAIRPENPRALSAKVHIILGRARAVRATGRDPGPELARAERFLDRAEPDPGFRWLLAGKRRLIALTRERLARLS